MGVSRTLVVTVGALALLASPVHAETVNGQAKVVDGDSLEISGQRIRLFGIDAPEASQTCDKQGEPWTCGKASADHLRSAIGDFPVSCNGNEHDQYARLVAVCSVEGVELNRYMVGEGWATAFRQYSDDYVGDETRARAARSGIWASNFETPQDYRHEQRGQRSVAPVRQVARASSGGCLIKGNRGRHGWIYHLPGEPYYEQTNAEEMFCSEAQARAAGYRRSRATR